MHKDIRAEHQQTREKLKSILTTAQLEELKKWGQSYRQQGEETTVLSSAELNESIAATVKELQLDPDKAQQFKALSLGHHHAKNELFKLFCSKMDKILTDKQRAKFAAMKKEL